MDNLTGKWGGADFHIILQEDEKNDIHQDDWNILQIYPYKHSIHQCIGYDEGFLVLQFGYQQIRVKPNHFQVSDEPQFKPFERVKYLNSKGVLEYGIVKGIHWHNNERRFYYDIEVNGKMKSRRYYDEDLEKSE